MLASAASGLQRAVPSERPSVVVGNAAILDGSPAPSSVVNDPVRSGPPSTAKKVWRIIPELDRDPRAIAYVQGLPGRIGLFAIMTALAGTLYALGVDVLVAPLAMTCAYTGSYRRYFVPLATLLLLYKHGFWVNVALVQVVIGQEGLASRLDAALLCPASLLAVLVVSSCLLASWPRLAALSIFRRPTLCLISGFVALVVAAQSPIVGGVPRAVLWSFVMAFQPYLWFLAYALASSNTLKQRPVWQHLGVFHPFWGSSMTPFGKGLAYLERYEAKTPEELAVTQLKGLKLACWTLLVAAFLRGFSYAVHDRFGLPGFDQVFTNFLGGANDPRYIAWASLVASFVEDLADITVWGGGIVACARLAGFRLLRNTYRPLEARSLAEFWNRYYFYYKELLVDHFFYPVFLRCFRANRKLRIFFATFTAACVGNLMFHFIRDIHFVAEMGWWRALSGEASHAFYTFLLAIGVGVSQARNHSRERSEGWLLGRLLPCLWVVVFFCVLHVFDAPLDRVHTIGQRMHFLTYLLGLDLWT